MGPPSSIALATALFLLLPISSSRSPSSSVASKGKEGARKGKIFNVFQVIRFANDPCAGANNMNGTCYTLEECEDRGGANGGACASGFGICCLMSISCGGMSSENCTYFTSENVMGGGCRATICPCNSNICQLRLDLMNFVITGPTTSTLTITKQKAQSGVVNAAGDQAVAAATQCQTDTFSVTNPGGATPPTICGINTGEHIYVEASDDCNDLTFQLGNMALGTTLAQRAWNIKITQLSCNFRNLAPQGCVQYFFGPPAGSVRSFNYNNRNGLHLADQDQQICVRRERGFCRLCWTTANIIDFGVNGKAQEKVQSSDKICCSFGAAGADMSGVDCIQIPGAIKNTAKVPVKSNLCGNKKGLPAGDAINGGATICTNVIPFSVNFRSDSFEADMEAAIGLQPGNVGFELVYFMDAIGCNPASIG